MADNDLTQYNGTPVFPTAADVGTNADPYLTPTDGEIITATSNAANQAPVNRSIYRIKDLLLGLRGALVGDFAGAVQKTVRSFFADGTGGNTHTVPAGELRASSHIQSTGGNMLVDTATGNFIGANALLSGFLRIGGAAPAQRLGGFIYGLFWGGTLTGSGDANPPRTTPLKNELRAKNVPKLWGRLKGTGGAFTIHKGCGGWTATLVDLGGGFSERYRIRVTIDAGAAMDDADYSVVVTSMGADGFGFNLPMVKTDTMTTTQFDITLFGVPTATQGNINVTVDAFDVSFDVFAQQTTA